MIVHVVVGGKGFGKTTFVKSLLKKIKNNRYLIYDVAADYTEFTRKALLPMNEFIEQARHVKNHVVVFEEATIFFSHSTNNEDMRFLLVRSRLHKNYVILVFHSLRKVPLNILDLANYVTLFKTADNEKFVEQKFNHDKLFNAFRFVNKSENKHISATISIY